MLSTCFPQSLLLRSYASLITEQLSKLANLQQQMQATRQRSKKQAILQEHCDLFRILRLIYDPSVTFGATSRCIKEELLAEKDLPEDPSKDLEAALKLLSERHCKSTQQCANSISQETLPSLRPIFRQCLDKNLQLGIGAQSILAIIEPDSAHPGLPISLGVPFDEEYVKKSMLKGINYLISRKYDGVRCLARCQLIKSRVTVELLSRSGKPIPNVEHLKRCIEDIVTRIGYNVILDGELVSIERDAAENFSRVMSIVSSKAASEERLKELQLKVFDVLQPHEFVKHNAGGKTLTQRLARWPGDHGPISLIAQHRLRSCSDLPHHSSEDALPPWEGIICRADVPYRGCRSRDILKIKAFSDAEFKALRVETSVMSFPPSILEPAPLMTAVVIEHKGVEVLVGSGWTVEQRQLFAKDQSQIVGKLITVQYFGETGRGSLRFPTVKAVHGDQRLF